MRGGRLLAEDSPELLMKKHNATLLEDIVLKLCLQDNTDEDAESNSSDSTTTDGSSVPAVPIPIPPSKKSRWKKMSQKERHSAMNAFNITTNVDRRNTTDSTSSSNIENSNNSNAEVVTITRSNSMNNNSNYTCPEQVVGLSYSSLEEHGEEGEEGKAPPTSTLQHGFDKGYLSDCSDSNSSNDSSSSSVKKPVENVSSNGSELSQSKAGDFKMRMRDSLNRVYAMSHKNIVILLRNLLLLLFMVFVPASQIVVICLAIGQDPKGLHFGLVNNDVNDPGNCTVPVGCLTQDNFTGSVSCLFLEYLKKHEILDVVRMIQIFSSVAICVTNNAINVKPYFKT